ncbi:type II membrane protein [Rhodotorula kratochvilovae]
MKACTTAGRALALLGGATAALAAWDCALQLGASRFDLAKIQGVHSWDTEEQTPPTVTKTRYALSLCSALPSPTASTPAEDDCPPGTRLCMRAFSARSGLEDRLLSVVPIAGELDGSELNPRAVEKEGEKVDKAWVLELGGGKYNGVEQKARIEMRCDDGAKETTPTVEDYDPKAGLLSLKWTTSAACATTNGGDPAPPPPPPKEGDSKQDKSSGGMGFFGWFFTLLFLALLGYFAVGAYHNYTTYGATGWDMVPHRDVWRDLPFVVADLFKGRGGSRNGYSALG